MQNAQKNAGDDPAQGNNPEQASVGHQQSGPYGAGSDYKAEICDQESEKDSPIFVFSRAWLSDKLFIFGASYKGTHHKADRQ